MAGGTTSEPGRAANRLGVGRGWLVRRSIILVVAAVLGALVPLIMLGVLTVNRAGEVVGDEVRKRLELTTSLSGELIHQYVMSWARLTEAAAARPELAAAVSDGDPANFDLETLDFHLSVLMALHPELSGNAVVDLGGVLRASPNAPELIGVDLTFRNYYQGLRASGDTFISEALLSAQAHEPLIVMFATYIHSIDQTGERVEPRAILLMPLYLDQIQAFTDQVAQTQGVRLWVTDAMGMLLATPDGRPSTLVHISQLPIAPVEAMGPGEVTEVDLGPETIVVSRQTIDQLGWQVYAAIGRQEARAGPVSIRAGVLAVGIPLVMVVCLGIWLLARYQRDEWRRDVELAQERDRADEANRQKSEFLSRMSHELRTPLNAVLGFAQVLEMDDLTQSQRDATGHILKGGRHLLGLVNEVLDISRVESGTLALSIEPVEVDPLIRETVDLVGPLAADRSIMVTFEPSGAFVHADTQRLRQLLLNLLSNAIKYNRENGLVTVTVETGRPGTTRVVVADTGPGLDQEKIGQIFVPFERLGAEKTGVEGAGIGLALSSGLARAMGGILEVESEPGTGSRFWVELPTAQPADVRISSKGQPLHHEDHSRRRAKILYVEDNPTNVSLVERVLQGRGGVRLISVMQGSLAVEMAAQHQPDVILLDAHLPDLDGEEVLARLKGDANTRDIPVVVVTADATAGRLERFLDAGATTYATKPIEVQQFLAILDDLLDGS